MRKNTQWVRSLCDIQHQCPNVVWTDLGESRAMRDALQAAQEVAARDTTVLLRGETGTGKGVLAQFIHSIVVF
jgi:transcriptional regulator with GAF, ATPase, and Fis domain